MKSFIAAGLFAVASIVGASQLAVSPSFAAEEGCPEGGCIYPPQPAEENGFVSPRPTDPTEEETGRDPSQSKQGGEGGGGGSGGGSDGDEG